MKAQGPSTAGATFQEEPALWAARPAPRAEHEVCGCGGDSRDNSGGKSRAQRSSREVCGLSKHVMVIVPSHTETQLAMGWGRSMGRTGF